MSIIFLVTMMIQRRMLQLLLSSMLRLPPRDILKRRLRWLNHQQSLLRKVLLLLLPSV
jgi:hypothetical protein